METFWTIGTISALALNAILFIVVLALVREIGIILVRLGPSRPLVTTEGADIGSTVRPIELTSVTGRAVAIVPTKSRLNLMLFMSPACNACEQLMPAVKTFSRAYRDRISVTLVSNLLNEGYHTDDGNDFAIVHSLELYRQFNIMSTPYAMLLDNNNVVVSRGAVNTLDELESLVSFEYKIETSRPVPTAPSIVASRDATVERTPL